MIIDVCFIGIHRQKSKRSNPSRSSPLTVLDSKNVAKKNNSSATPAATLGPEGRLSAVPYQEAYVNPLRVFTIFFVSHCLSCPPLILSTYDPFTDPSVRDKLVLSGTLLHNDTLGPLDSLTNTTPRLEVVATHLQSLEEAVADNSQGATTSLRNDNRQEATTSLGNDDRQVCDASCFMV